MQAGDETGAVGFLAAAVAVAEPDDVGAMLLQSGIERQAFGVVDLINEVRNRRCPQYPKNCIDLYRPYKLKQVPRYLMWVGQVASVEDETERACRDGANRGKRAVYRWNTISDARYNVIPASLGIGGPLAGHKVRIQ